MSKYKCKICGYIYDEDVMDTPFNELSDDYKCSMCMVSKDLFELIENEQLEKKEEKKLENAIPIDSDNIAIERDISRCIDCGMCTNICKNREGINDICHGKACVNCGQCIQFCPTGALIPKKDILKFKKAKEEGKILIAYTSPSVRVAIGDELGYETGSFIPGKLVASLRKLGFKYVLDVTFAADLTIMEEANELIERIKNNKTLPMFTSCCPAWIKYAEIFYPEIIPHISTCKSPIGMMGAVVKNYFSLKNNIDKDNIYTVAITPCTAKKFEIAREEISGTDLVLTTKELSDLIKNEKIDFKSLDDSEFDSLLGTGSGAGVIFGNTGGVMEAALREAHYILTGEELDKSNINYNEVRGMDNVREATITIGEKQINIAVVHQMSSAIPLLEEVKKGTSKYHYIEIMNCLGGCIGGGGQPKAFNEKQVKEKRIESLYENDKNSNIRISHQNPDIIKIYNEYLEKPLSSRAEELLHTTYQDRSNILK